MISDTLIFPALDGRYPALSCGVAHPIWLGGHQLCMIYLQHCYRGTAGFSVSGVINSNGMDHYFEAKGVASSSEQLVAGLLSSFAQYIPDEMESGIERDRLVDAVFDQLSCNDNQCWLRLSQGAFGGQWLTPVVQEKQIQKNKGNLSLTFGDFMRHPFIVFVLGHSLESAASVAHGEGRIMPEYISEQVVHPPVLVIDEKKPQKRTNAPIFRHLGIVLTGAREGLEAWAREMAVQHSRPLIVFRSKEDVTLSRHLVGRSKLVSNNPGSLETLGRLRLDLLEVSKG